MHEERDASGKLFDTDNASSDYCSGSPSLTGFWMVFGRLLLRCHR